MRPPRPVLCKTCGLKFVRTRPIQEACSIDCMVKLGLKKLDAKKEKDRKIQSKTLKEGRIALKSSKTLLTEALGRAQDAVNAWVRQRDRNAGHGCISCGKMPAQGGDFHAGHFIGRKASPEKRFLEENINLQCYKCNVLNSGGIGVAYEAELIKRIGKDRVDWLKGPHAPLKLTIEDAKRIAAEYKAKLKKDAL